MQTLITEDEISHQQSAQDWNCFKGNIKNGKSMCGRHTSRYIHGSVYRGVYQQIYTWVGLQRCVPADIHMGRSTAVCTSRYTHGSFYSGVYQQIYTWVVLQRCVPADIYMGQSTEMCTSSYNWRWPISNRYSESVFRCNVYLSHVLCCMLTWETLKTPPNDSVQS